MQSRPDRYQEFGIYQNILIELVELFIDAKNTKKKKDSDGDELLMIQDLRKLRPFSFQSGRLHNAFPNIKKSVIEYMNVDHYHSWIRSRIVINENELGQ